MSRPVSDEWLLIVEVTVELQITYAEWLDFEARRDVPLGVVWPDGVTRISRQELNRWLDAHTSGGGGGEGQ